MIEWRTYGPNSAEAGIVSPKRAKTAWIPIRITQLVGGKSWSLAFIRIKGEVQTP